MNSPAWLEFGYQSNASVTCVTPLAGLHYQGQIFLAQSLYNFHDRQTMILQDTDQAFFTPPDIHDAHN